MLFKGVLLNIHNLATYTAHIGKKVVFPGIIIASKNLKTALNYSLCMEAEHPEGRTPVLFLFLVRNYYRFDGMKITSQNMAAYIQDDDYFIKEGADSVVL